MDEFCGSKFWDTELTWKTQNPRFTPCFEETVLIWVPCGFLFGFSLIDILNLKNSQNTPITWTPLGVFKTLFAILLLIIEILGILWERSILREQVSEERFNGYVGTIGHSIQGTTYILYLALLTYSRRRGIHSSGVQSIFWLLLLITETIKFISLIQDSSKEIGSPDLFPFIIGVINYPIIVAQFFLHLFSDASFTLHHHHGYKSLDNISPEKSSSFFSRILFHWFTPMVYNGYKQALEYTDLWNLNSEDTSKALVHQFDSKYPKNLNRAFIHSTQQQSDGQKQRKKSISRAQLSEEWRKGKKNPIVKDEKNTRVLIALLKSFGWSYLFGTFLRFIPDLLVFVSPQILTLLIAFVEADSDSEPLWKGLLYAGVLFVTAFTGTCVLAQATHRFYLTGMRARTVLVSAIYRKALLLSNTAKRETTVGEIVNLMSVDVQRGTEFAQYACLLLVAPIQIGLALYFLWGILGPSSLAGLVVMILILPMNAYIAKKIRKLQEIQMEKKDERVKLMNEILSGIKVLKFYAWELCYEKKVMDIRALELKVMKETAIWNALTNVLWQCAPFLIALSTFGTYVLLDRDNVLDAQKTFVSLSLFNIMSSPLTFLPLIIVGFVQAGVAFRRIDRYLNSDEIDTTLVTHDQNESDPIVISNGSFSWDDDITLRDINIRVKEGSLIAIVGNVGSGKSTLLSAMLGELNKIQGRINTKGRIAYVSQQAWIQNATLRENILFGSEFDPVKYDRVIQACALKPDLEILPAGDQTEIGEKGINLSGGQKQRVALARATYANGDLYLLDDTLSAVDAHVGRHIFDELIGPKGLLRHKTRVLVTHGVVYLPHMDNIHVLKNGTITEQGTYTQLLQQKGEFADFLTTHLTPEDVEEFEESDLIEGLKSVLDEGNLNVIKERRQSIVTATGGSESEIVTSGEQAGRKRKGRKERVKKKEESYSDGDKLIEAEKSETESVKISIYLDYFKAAGLIFSSGTFILYLVFQVFAVGGNLWLSEWSNQSEDKFKITRDYYLGIYGGFGLFQMLCILGATLVMAFGTVNSASVLHLGMLKRILRAPMYFFDTTPIGRIVNRFAKDVDILDSILPLFLRFWLNGIFTVLATLVVISYSTPIFVGVIIPIMIIYYLVQKFYVASSRQLKRLESVTRSPIYSHFGETISGASTIRAYRQQERFVIESERKVDYNQISYFASIVANRWLAVRLETIGNLVVLFAALFAVLGRETLGPGIVGLSISYALQITLSLLMLVRFTSDVETNIVAVERLQEYSDAPQEAPFVIPGRRPRESWPEKGEVVFSNYETRYRPGLELVLKGVSCTINPKEKIGIVGRTGAGKSSLTLALFRIIEGSHGKITIDGEDISRLGLHDIRGRISIIPQDPVLFSGTLRENLDPFDSFSDDIIWNTLELAHLKPFVKSLSAGLNHEIAEGGENLSVGQRQLICLARALLRKTRILILDEATAAVDLDTDDLIQNTIRKEFKDSTVITIAHRLNTILDSTRVIVLDKGEIREFDSPINLLNNLSSLFFKMAKESGSSNLFQRLSVALQRGNVISTLGCVPAGNDLGEIFKFKLP